jgi:EmrB/QacA subfamily drug resistance transporter
MACIMAGTIMVVLDIMIVNLVLHQIGVDLGAVDGIEWVATAYLLGVCASVPVSGWLATRFGVRRVFLASVVAFTVSSAACAAAPSLGMLIALRTFQGAGGGAIMPIGLAIVLDMYPKERHGGAVAKWGVATMIAPAIGPSLGGWVATDLSWRWLFLLYVPVGVAVLAVGWRAIPDIGHRARSPFDLVGFVLGSSGIALLLVALSEGHGWGWTSAATTTCFLGGSLALIAFVHRERATAHPMIDLAIFEERGFRLAVAATFFSLTAQWARLISLPLQLQSVRGVTALTVGLLFVPAAFTAAAGMSIAGRSINRVGVRPAILCGCLVMMVSMLGLSRLTLTTPLVVIAVVVALQSFGHGLVSTSAMVAGLSELPPAHLAQGTAVRNMVAQGSGAFAVAMQTAVVALALTPGGSPQDEHAAYNTVFLVTAGFVAIAIVLAARLPRGASQVRPAVDESVVLAVE